MATIPEPTEEGYLWPYLTGSIVVQDVVGISRKIENNWFRIGRDTEEIIKTIISESDAEYKKQHVEEFGCWRYSADEAPFDPKRLEFSVYEEPTYVCFDGLKLKGILADSRLIILGTVAGIFDHEHVEHSAHKDMMAVYNEVKFLRKELKRILRGYDIYTSPQAVMIRNDRTMYSAQRFRNALDEMLRQEQVRAAHLGQ